MSLKCCHCATKQDNPNILFIIRDSGLHSGRQACKSVKDHIKEKSFYLNVNLMSNINEFESDVLVDLPTSVRIGLYLLKNADYNEMHQWYIFSWLFKPLTYVAVKEVSQ